MQRSDSIEVDRRLVKRIATVVSLLFVFAAGFTTLLQFYSRKFQGATTRNAQWIWASQRLSSRVPVAFFAVRDFDLPATRRYAHIKIYGDPGYTIYFNGKEVASRRIGNDNRMDLYDVSTLARNKANRVVVVVRSTNGIGGLIFGLDIEPENENFIVSDRAWKIFRVWQPQLILRDPPGGRGEAPMVLGEPPFGRWNFLGVVERSFSEPVKRVITPRAAIPLRAVVPTLREVSGVTVAGTEALRAVAFDFGAGEGRVRLTLDSDSSVPRVVGYRFASMPSELKLVEPVTQSLVFAPGERTVTDPNKAQFRYVVVMSTRAKAEVAQ